MKKLFISLLIFSLAGIKGFASGHVATATYTNPTCSGSCNGTAYAVASGGVGPYGYTWTGPATFTAAGQTLSGLCAGVYIVTAIDSSDMSIAQYTVNLTDPSPLTVTVNPATICAGSSVMLNAVVSGGTPAYLYSWAPASSLSSPTVATPTAFPTGTTTYTVTVTDANGCVATTSTTITVNPVPLITVNSASMCIGGMVTLSASGAATYSWSPGSGLSSTSGATVTASPTATTTYTVTGTFGGCSNTALTTVTVGPPPVISVSPTAASCGMCNGSIVATVSPFGSTFFWAGPAGYSSTIANPTNLCAGTYTLTVVTTAGCSSTQMATVGTSSPVTVAITSVTPASCGACDGSASSAARHPVRLPPSGSPHRLWNDAESSCG